MTTEELAKLTPEQKRIRITELCGRCAHRETKYYCIEDGNSCDTGFTCVACGEDPNRGDSRVPDYLNDLNACYEFEKTLTDEEYTRFENAVWEMVTQQAKWTPVPTIAGSYINLPTKRIRFTSPSAPQRADAYLLIKG